MSDFSNNEFQSSVSEDFEEEEEDKGEEDESQWQRSGGK